MGKSFPSIRSGRFHYAYALTEALLPALPALGGALDDELPDGATDEEVVPAP